MTYTPIQLSAIKLFGRKDLTEGCIVRYYSDSDEQWEIIKYIRTYEKENGMMVVDAFEDGRFIRTWLSTRFSKKQEILGHIPHLEDLFRVAEEKGLIYEIAHKYIKREWVHILCLTDIEEMTTKKILITPTIPLLNQPSLPEILNLFK